MSEHNKESESKGMSAGTILKIGASVAALGAATYYLFGPDGKGNRKHLKGWMIRMKGEIIEKIEDARDVTEATYHHIVDDVVGEYVKAGKISVDEIKNFAEELKSEWKNISTHHHAHAAHGSHAGHTTAHKKTAAKSKSKKSK